MKLQNTPYGRPPFTRAISIFTLAFFLSTHLSYGVPTAFAAFANSIKEVTGGTPSEHLLRLAREPEIRIPPELGIIDETNSILDAGSLMLDKDKLLDDRSWMLDKTKIQDPTSTFKHPTSKIQHPKSIIYIQDAHDSLEAQENIAKIIDHLVTNYGVKTVFEEGYEGPVPTDKYFGAIKDPEIKEKVSYFLMDHLRLGGAEYAHINRARGQMLDDGSLMLDKNLKSKNQDPMSKFQGPKSKIHHPTSDFALVGADSIKLHRKNIAQYRKSAKWKKSVTADLEALDKEIKGLADRHFPKELREWIRQKELFDGGQLPLLDYLKRTANVLDKNSHYPNIQLVIGAEKTTDEEVLAKVKNINAKDLFIEMEQMEKDAAERYLQTSPPRENLVLRGLRLVPARHFAARSEVRAPRYQARTEARESPPRWGGRTVTQSALRALNRRSSIGECNQKIFNYYRAIQLLKRLNDLRLSFSEYQAVKDSLRQLNTEQMAQFIGKETKKTLILSRQWEKNIREAVEFYEIAQERDNVIAGQMENFLQNPDEKVAVLVFGGFHKNNIKEMLKQFGIHCIIVSPSITQPSSKHEAYYKRLMTVGRHSYEPQPQGLSPKGTVPSTTNTVPDVLARATRPESRLEIWDSHPLFLARKELRLMAAAARIPVHNSSFAIEQALKASASQRVSRSEIREKLHLNNIDVVVEHSEEEILTINRKYQGKHSHLPAQNGLTPSDSRDSANFIDDLAVVFRKKWPRPLSSKPQFEGSEALIIGPGSSGEEVVRLIHRYRDLKAVHVLTASPYDLINLDRRLQHLKDTGELTKIPEIKGYLTSMLELPGNLVGNLDLVIECRVVDSRIFSQTQMDQAESQLKIALKEGGLLFSRPHDDEWGYQIYTSDGLADPDEDIVPEDMTYAYVIWPNIRMKMTPRPETRPINPEPGNSGRDAQYTAVDPQTFSSFARRDEAESTWPDTRNLGHELTRTLHPGSYLSLPGEEVWFRAPAKAGSEIRSFVTWVMARLDERFHGQSVSFTVSKGYCFNRKNRLSREKLAGEIIFVSVTASENRTEMRTQDPLTVPDGKVIKPFRPDIDEIRRRDPFRAVYLAMLNSFSWGHYGSLGQKFFGGVLMSLNLTVAAFSMLPGAQLGSANDELTHVIQWYHQMRARCLNLWQMRWTDPDSAQAEIKAHINKNYRSFERIVRSLVMGPDAQGLDDIIGTLPEPRKTSDLEALGKVRQQIIFLRDFWKDRKAFVAGKNSNENVSASFAEVKSRLIDVYESTKGKLVIEADPAAENARVGMSYVRFFMLLSHLVGNAMGPVLETRQDTTVIVHLTMDQATQELIIRVTDNAPSIEEYYFQNSEDGLPNLFTIEKEGKKVHIGLWDALDIVGLSGGSIEVMSGAQEGNKFEIHLPLAKSRPEMRRAQNEEPPALTEQSPIRSPINTDPEMVSKITPAVLQAMKVRSEKIVMTTGYNQEDTELLERAGIEVILVGDSYGMVRLGFPDTTHVTMEHMIEAVSQASKGISKALLVGDMPYQSYENPAQAVENAQRLIQAGATVIKLEGGQEVAAIVKAIVEKGIPVMGHIAYTPQTVQDHKIKGRGPQEAKQLLEDAFALEEAGVFAIVIELADRDVSREISRRLRVPTIGIGAGPDTDGQVLVLDDLLGRTNFGNNVRYPAGQPKMIGQWDRSGGELAVLQKYRQKVKAVEFPDAVSSFSRYQGPDLAEVFGQPAQPHPDRPETRTPPGTAETGTVSGMTYETAKSYAAALSEAYERFPKVSRDNEYAQAVLDLFSERPAPVSARRVGKNVTDWVQTVRDRFPEMPPIEVLRIRYPVDLVWSSNNEAVIITYDPSQPWGQVRVGKTSLMLALHNLGFLVGTEDGAFLFNVGKFKFAASTYINELNGVPFILPRTMGGRAVNVNARFGLGVIFREIQLDSTAREDEELFDIKEVSSDDLNNSPLLVKHRCKTPKDYQELARKLLPYLSEQTTTRTISESTGSGGSPARSEAREKISIGQASRILRRHTSSQYQQAVEVLQRNILGTPATSPKARKSLALLRELSKTSGLAAPVYPLVHQALTTIAQEEAYSPSETGSYAEQAMDALLDVLTIPGLKTDKSKDAPYASAAAAIDKIVLHSQQQPDRAEAMFRKLSALANDPSRSWDPRAYFAILEALARMRIAPDRPKSIVVTPTWVTALVQYPPGRPEFEQAVIPYLAIADTLYLAGNPVKSLKLRETTDPRIKPFLDHYQAGLNDRARLDADIETAIAILKNLQSRFMGDGKDTWIANVFGPVLTELHHVRIALQGESFDFESLPTQICHSGFRLSNTSLPEEDRRSMIRGIRSLARMLAVDREHAQTCFERFFWLANLQVSRVQAGNESQISVVIRSSLLKYEMPIWAKTPRELAERLRKPQYEMSDHLRYWFWARDPELRGDQIIISQKDGKFRSFRFEDLIQSADERQRFHQAISQSLIPRDPAWQSALDRQWLAERAETRTQGVPPAPGTSSNNTVSKIQPVNLVIQGGGAQALEALGGIRALLAAGVPIGKIAGTSSGAILAGLIADVIQLGQPGRTSQEQLAELDQLIDEYFIHSDFMEFLDWRLPFISPSAGWNVSLFQGRKLQQWLKQMLKRRTGKANPTFKDLPLVHVFATDWDTREAVELSAATTPDMPVADAILASSSLPWIFPWQRFNVNGKMRRLFDGAWSKPVPYETFLNLKKSGEMQGPILVLLTNGDAEDTSQSPFLIKLLYRIFFILKFLPGGRNIFEHYKRVLHAQDQQTRSQTDLSIVEFNDVDVGVLQFGLNQDKKRELFNRGGLKIRRKLKLPEFRRRLGLPAPAIRSGEWPNWAESVLRGTKGIGLDTSADRRNEQRDSEQDLLGPSTLHAQRQEEKRFLKKIVAQNRSALIRLVTSYPERHYKRNPLGNYSLRNHCGHASRDLVRRLGLLSENIPLPYNAYLHEIQSLLRHLGKTGTTDDHGFVIVTFGDSGHHYLLDTTLIQFFRDSRSNANETGLIMKKLLMEEPTPIKRCLIQLLQDGFIELDPEAARMYGKIFGVYSLTPEDFIQSGDVEKYDPDYDAKKWMAATERVMGPVSLEETLQTPEPSDLWAERALEQAGIFDITAAAPIKMHSQPGFFAQSSDRAEMRKHKYLEPVPITSLSADEDIFAIQLNKILLGSARATIPEAIAYWVRYHCDFAIGYGAYWETSAFETMNLRRGMSFNLSNLFVNGMRKLGFEAEYGVTQVRKEVYQKFLSPEHYETMPDYVPHVFARVKDSGQWKYVDFVKARQGDVFIAEKPFVADGEIGGEIRYLSDIDAWVKQQAQLQSHEQMDALGNYVLQQGINEILSILDERLSSEDPALELIHHNIFQYFSEFRSWNEPAAQEFFRAAINQLSAAALRTKKIDAEAIKGVENDPYLLSDRIAALLMAFHGRPVKVINNFTWDDSLPLIGVDLSLPGSLQFIRMRRKDCHLIGFSTADLAPSSDAGSLCVRSGFVMLGKRPFFVIFKRPLPLDIATHGDVANYGDAPDAFVPAHLDRLGTIPVRGRVISDDTFRLLNDKFLQAAFFKKHGIHAPKTVALATETSLAEIESMMDREFFHHGAKKLFVKKAIGRQTRGNQVFAHSQLREAAVSALQSIHEGQRIVVQQAINKKWFFRPLTCWDGTQLKIRIDVFVENLGWCELSDPRVRPQIGLRAIQAITHQTRPFMERVFSAVTADTGNNPFILTPDLMLDDKNQIAVLELNAGLSSLASDYYLRKQGLRSDIFTVLANRAAEEHQTHSIQQPKPDAPGTASTLTDSRPEMRTDAPLGDLFREGAFNYGRDLLLHHWKRIRAVLSGNLFVSPYEYEIQPTTRCNLRCAHCIGAQLFGKGNVLDLDPVAFEQFLHHDVIDLNTDLNRKQLSPKIDPDLFQVRTIKFLGLIGEPLTVFPKIEGGIRQLLEFNLKAAGTPLGPIALGLFTNGILLFDHPAMPDPLAIANWLLRFTYVNVSLDADSPATFSQSKGAEPKVFEIIIDNLRRLVVLRNAARSKLNITVSYTLNKMNWSGIRQITELLKNLGVDRLRFRMDLTNNQETGMSPSDIHSAYDQIEQAHHDFQQDNFEVVPIHSREEALQMPFTIHFSRCFAGYFMGTLAANGLNYGCDHQALPFSGGLRDIQSWLPPFDARKRCAICAPFTFKINLLMNYLADQIQKEPDFLDRFEQEVVDPLRRSFHRTEMRNLAEQLTPSALQALKFGRVFKDDRYRLQLLHGPHDELYVAKSVGWLAPTYEKILLDRERKMLQRFHRNGPTLGFPRPVTDILSWDSDEIEKPVQFDKDGTLTGFIMSYLPGVSGDAPEILSHTTSNTQTLWQILYQSAKLLKTVHDHSYVHRDICPSQYLIDLGSGNHPTLSLIDFETALPANARRVGHESKIRTSDFWELSWNRKLSWDHTTSPQFDIFSWGITAYLWTTGQKIPQGGDIPFLKEHPFGAILHKAAAVDRSKRYTSMDEILRDLEAIGRQLGFLSDQVPLAGGKPDSIRNEMRQHTADKDALWAMVSSESYRRHLQATHDRYTELFLQDPEVRTLADEAGWDDRELRQRLQDIRQTPKEDLHIHLEGAISTPGIRLIARYVHERMGPEEREKFWNNFAYHIDPRKKDVKIQRFSDVVSGDDMQTAILDPEGHDLNHLNVSRYTEHNPGWAPLTDTLPLITYLHRPYAMGALLLNPTILPQRLLDEVVYLAVADAALNALQDGVETLHLRIKADPDNVAINPDYLRSLISAARDVENRMQSEGKKIRVRFVLSFSRKIDSRVRAPKSQEPSAGDVEAYLQKHFIGPLDQLTGEEHEWLSGIDIVGNEAAGLAVAKRNLPYITYAVRQIQALRDRKGVKGKFMVDVHVGENFKDPETGVQMMELYLDGIDERDSHALIHGAALAAAQTNNPVRQNVVGKMAQRQTPLLISLSSNRHTGALDRLLLFPVAELEDQGLRLQASTDDPRASHTTRSLEQLKMDLIRAVQTIRAPRPEMRTNDIVPARSEQTSNTTGQITNHDSAIATKDADWDSPSLRELVVPLTDGTSVTGIVEELSQDTTTMKAGPVLHFKFSNGHELFIPLSSADALSSAGTRDWLKQEVVFAFEQGLYDYSDPAQLIESFLKTSLWKKNVYFIGNFSDDEMTRLFTGMDQTKLLNYIGKDEIPPGTQTAWDKIVRLAAVDLAARELVEYHDRLRKASLLAIKFLGDEDIPELLKDRSEPAQIDPGNALQETVARAIATPPQDGSFHKGNAFRDEMTLAVINARPSQEDFRTIFDHMVNARLKAAYRLWQSGIASERIIIKRIADARRFRLNGSGNLDNTTSMDKTDLKYRWLYGLIEQKFFANMAFSEGSSIRTYERKVPIGHRGFQHAQKIMMIGNNYIDIEHANSKDVPAGLAELEELWNTVKNASDRDKQYKALAEFEWLFFQINPASRSGAALGDALSLVLQIATGMKLRKGYIHLDQALAFSKDEYIVWRSEELRTANAINDGQTGEIHRPEMRAQDTILSYLRTYLDALQDPARSKALNTDGLEADGRRLIDVDITGVGSKRIKETEANDPADIYVSSDARDCALIITLSKSNTKADKPVRNLFHFFQSEETVNDFDAMLTGREKLMIIVYDEAETIFEQLPPVFIRAFPDLKFLLIRDKKNNVKNGIAMEEGFGLNVGKTTGQNVVPTAETSKLFALTWDELASLTADNPVTIIPIEELPQRQQALSQGSSQTRTEMRDLGQDLVENYVTKEFGTVPVRLPDELVRAYFGEQVLQDSQHKGRSFFIRKLDSNTDLHFLEEWKTQLQSDEAWLHQWAAKGRSREIAKGRFPYFGFISVQALGIISQAEGKETLEGFIGFEALHHTFDAKRRQFTSGINISQIEVYYRNLGHEGRIQGIPDLLLDILISMAADPNLNVTGGIQLNPMTPGSKAFATRRNFEAPRDRLRLLPQSRVQQEAERILETTPTIRRIVPYAPERHVEMRNTNPILPDLSPTIPQENDADHRESPPKEEQGKVVRPELRKAALEENKQTDIATPKSFEGRPEASNFKAGETTPSHILHLTQPVIAILEQARIDTLSPESFKELLEIAGLNNGKLHLVIPDVLKGKYSARVAELRKIATVHYHFPQLANSEDIPVIGFSDAEKDEHITEFQERLAEQDPSLAQRIKDSAFRLNRPGDFGVGIWYALKEIPPDAVRPDSSGFRGDRDGRYCALVTEELKNYAVFSASA